MAIERSSRQEYVVSRSGRRLAAHTPRLRGQCGCQTCALGRYWTPERRAERSEALRRQYAAGRRRLRHNPNDGRPSVWTREADQLLRSLVGRADVRTMAERVTEATGSPRTVSAVVHRIKHLGLSRMALRPLSASEVGRLFGITRETVRTRLVRPGLLVGALRSGGPYGMRLFERSELERLVTDHPELFPPEQIRDSGLRALAVAAVRGRRLLDTAEVTRRTGAQQRELAAWYAAGLIPSAKKVRGRRGAGGGWLIEAGDLAVVSALWSDLQARRRRRAVACSAGHRWDVDGYVEQHTGQRRCRACRRSRGTPVRCRLRLLDRTDALSRVVGRVRLIAA